MLGNIVVGKFEYRFNRACSIHFLLTIKTCSEDTRRSRAVSCQGLRRQGKPESRLKFVLNLRGTFAISGTTSQKKEGRCLLITSFILRTASIPCIITASSLGPIISSLHFATPIP